MTYLRTLKRAICRCFFQTVQPGLRRAPLTHTLAGAHIPSRGCRTGWSG